MRSELVSVIITAYNVSDYLRETLNSVLNQTYKKLEIIIVDDGSTDKTPDILKEFAANKQFKIIFNKHSGNIGRNLNDCIRNSSGSIIAVMGADDLWDPEKTEIQLKYLNDYKLVCTNKRVINSEGKIVNPEDKIKHKEFYDLKHLLFRNDILASSVIGYKEIFEECGMFDEEMGNRSEDYALWLSIAEKYRIKFVSRVLVSYRIHGKNLSHKSYDDIKAVTLRNMYHIKKYLSYSDKKIQQAAKNGLAAMYARLSKYSYINGNLKEAVSDIRKSIVLYKPKMSLYFLKCCLYYLFITVKQVMNRNKIGVSRKLFNT